MARSKKNSGSKPGKDQTVETAAEETLDDVKTSDLESMADTPQDDIADESFDETLDDVLKPSDDGPDGDTSEPEGVAVEAVAPKDADDLQPTETADADATDALTVDEVEPTDTDGAGDALDDKDAPTETAEAETAPLVPPVVAPTEVKRGPGFVPLVIGGLVAGAIGYAIPTYILPSDGDSTARLDALEAQVAAIPSVELPDLSPITTAQDALRADVDALVERVSALEEAGPVTAAGSATGASTATGSTGGGGPDIAALVGRTDGIETALTDLTGRVDVLESGFGEATGAAASVVAEAEALARQAAQNQITLALQSGVPFAEQVEILGDVPADLAAVADDGVVTQATLVADFPPLAREALRLARSSESGGGMGSLFRNAFNPRSLEPREGDDPDAVLSRAEAAVRGGDIAAALTEMEGLPAEAAAPLADWRTRAETRAAALAAADAYLQDG